MSRHLRLLLAATAMMVAPLAALHAAAPGPEGATDFSAQLVNPSPQPQPQARPAPQQPAGALVGGGRPAARPFAPPRPAAAAPPGRPAFVPGPRPAPGALVGPGRPSHPGIVRHAAPPRHVGPPPHRRHGHGAPHHVHPRHAAPLVPPYATPRHARPLVPRHGGRHVTYIRGPHYVHRRGAARRLAAVTALSALYLGSRYYYPYAYVPVVERTCYGVTPEGCELDWAEVPTVEGYIVEQCVAYCPR